MDYIDRYIYAVLKRLPQDNRSEVEKELRSNIDDMLPENYDDAQVEGVLQQLGNPKDLAEEYRKSKRYLIPPYLYDEYMHILKLCTTIYVGFILTLQLISFFGDFHSYVSTLDMFIDLSIHMTYEVISGMAASFFGVTVAFVCIDRLSKNNENREKKSWSIKELTAIPNTKSISASEVVFEMSFITIFTYIFCFRPEIMGLYGENRTVLEPLFSSVLRLYIPAFIFLFFITIMLSIIKLKCASWNIKLAWMNCFADILGMIIFLAFLLNPNIYNPAFIQEISIIIQNHQHSIGDLFFRNATAVSAVVVVLSYASSIFNGFRAAKTF